VTREHKLALIVGFSLVLVLGVLISDHFSKARQMQLAEETRPATAREMGAGAGAAIPSQPAGFSAAQPGAQAGLGRPDLVPLPLPGRGGDANSTTSLVLRPIGLDGAGAAPASPLASTQAQVTPRGAEPVDGGGAAPAAPPVPVAQIPMQKYEVHEGDTLYRIAQKVYGEARLWEKIREYNKDKVGAGGELRDGTTLQLPPKDVLLGKPYVPPGATRLEMANDPGAGAGGAARPPSDQRANAADGKFRDYTVKDGDTLISIARKQLGAGKRWQEIAEANKGTLSDPEALSAGMKIRIPAR